MNSFRWMVSVVLLATACPVLRAEPADAADPDSPFATPDLAVAELTTTATWCSAHAGNETFRRLLRADLQALQAETACYVHVGRTLPRVNYVLISVQPFAKVDVAASSGELPREAPTVGPSQALERVRRAVLELSYVEYCFFNPTDQIVWNMLGGYAATPAFGERVSPVHKGAEVAPDELVVVLDGGLLPVLEIEAALTAGLDSWHSAWRWHVPVALSVAPVDGTAGGSGGATRELQVPFYRGRGQLRTALSLPTDKYGVMLDIDPDNRIPESDEKNNEVSRTVAMSDSPAELRGRASPPDSGGGVAVEGDLTVANFAEAPLELPLSALSARVGNAAVELRWGLPSDISAEPIRAEGDMLVVPPGHVGRARFEGHADGLPVGEHELVAESAEHGIYAACPLEVPSPPPAINLFPVADEGTLRDVVVVPSVDDRNVRHWLINETWRTFDKPNSLLDVRIAEWHILADKEESANGETEERDDANAYAGSGVLPLDLRFAVGASPGEEALDAYCEQLADLWFAAAAWWRPTPVMGGAEGDDGERAVAAPHWASRRVWVRIDSTADPRRCQRVAVPVSLELQNLSADDAAEARPSTDPAPVAVPVPINFEPLSEGPEDIAYMPRRVVVPLFSPGTVRAVCYLDKHLPAVCKVIVDPEGQLEEGDETDNACVLRKAEPPPEQPVFRAHAWIDRRLPDDRALTVPEFELVVRGTLHNRGDDSITLTFPTSLQMDFSWADLYRWSDGRGFLQVITEIDIPAGDSHQWEIRTPFRELWKAVADRLAAEAPWRGAGRGSVPQEILLNVVLVGTEYQVEAPVNLPISAENLLDADGDWLPDFWEEEFGIDAEDSEEQPADDADGDGWPDWHEFLENTNPRDRESCPPGRAFRLALAKGWNLVSLPVVPENASLSDIFGTAVHGRVWQWAQTDGDGEPSYREARQIDAHTAYWVYATEAVERIVPGTPHSSGGIRIPRGWSMSGAGGPMQLPEAVRRDGTVWGWSAEKQAYVPAQEGVLEEGKGYWIWSRQPVETSPRP